MRDDAIARTNELRDLVLKAFEQARISGAGQWRYMTTSSLRGRLIALSSGRFAESLYGAKTMTALMRRLSDIVRVDSSRLPPVVHLISDLPRAVSIPEPSADELFQQYRTQGESLCAGEVLAEVFQEADVDELDDLVARTVAAWASPPGYTKDLKSLSELAGHLSEFTEEHLACAIVNALARLEISGITPSQQIYDLAFRVLPTISSIFQIEPKRRPIEVCNQSVAKLKAARMELIAAVDQFQKSNSISAKSASLEIVRKAHSLNPYSLSTERPLLREIEVILGPAFRKFCEACERHEPNEVLRRAVTLKDQLIRLRTVEGAQDSSPRSTLWRNTIGPISAHVLLIVEEATRRSEVNTKPELRIASADIRIDLQKVGEEQTFLCRLTNSGSGRAYGVEISHGLDGDDVELRVARPQGPLDLPAETDQLITISIVINRSFEFLRIPCSINCTNGSGTPIEFQDSFNITQQALQPNWDLLLRTPPYTTNPIRHKKDLYGRDALLADLRIHVFGGNSTFLWGQKRVGKTSVLQVLASELRAQSNVSCVVLRMGELSALHEGQIACRIAERLVAGAEKKIPVPSETEFGAGFGKLVPYMERLSDENPSSTFVVIVDEFDDISPTLYSGERGRQFIKALRSLSEVGLVFFFVGSERMDVIYRTHQTDLNKWINMSLDRIVAKEDCRALIQQPLDGVIDYEDAAIELITEYCLGNPFYMHLLCFEIFKRCAQERRTFVSVSDAQLVQAQMARVLGATNFAYLWEDNPELDGRIRVVQTAENCLVLSALASLGGSCEGPADLVEAQERMGLAAGERMQLPQVRESVERLRVRKVLETTNEGHGLRIALPIFRDWITERWDVEVLPTWNQYVRDRPSHSVEPNKQLLPSSPETFPIPEDDLLAVSQRLVFCRKQKDVAEVRQWLRQFDDDNRIEVAFLLLQRLVDKGNVLDADRVRALETVVELVNKRRSVIGNREWVVRRNRLDNLCVTFLDSETKSGASTARELSKQLRPGKCGSPAEISQWMFNHQNEDPILLIVDDFAGTGKTIADGWMKLQANIDPVLLERFLNEGRVSLYLLFAFKEAVDRIRDAEPRIDIAVTQYFGDEVRGLDPEAQIFEDENELGYAKEILLQIGRELYPKEPLGFGDLAALVLFPDSIPNNTIPIFWCTGMVSGRPWRALFPRA